MAKSGLRRLRRVKYPIWSVRTVSIVSILIVALIAVPTFLIGDRTALENAEWTAALLAVTLFCFLAYCLFTGARVRKHEPTSVSFQWVDVQPESIDPSGLDLSGFADDNPLGIVIGLVLMIVLALLLILALPLIVNGIWLVICVLLVALFWIFRAALRQAFARSRQCRGKWMASLKYAAFYTLIYTSWLFAVLFALRWRQL